MLQFIIIGSKLQRLPGKLQRLPGKLQRLPGKLQRLPGQLQRSPVLGKFLFFFFHLWHNTIFDYKNGDENQDMITSGSLSYVLWSNLVLIPEIRNNCFYFSSCAVQMKNGLPGMSQEDNYNIIYMNEQVSREPYQDGPFAENWSVREALFELWPWSP